MSAAHTTLIAISVLAAVSALSLEPIPDKTVVLTFDDAVKSHVTFVAPLLKELGFGATFFVTHCWMDDTENFMSWEDVGQLHEMGFEIGNHTYTHTGVGSPKTAGFLEGELALVESALTKVGVPKPVSFAWPGNGFATEGVAVLEKCGYRFARRGMQPEVAYGKLAPGPLYDPNAHHPLLLPSAGDAYPDWTLANFRAVVDRAKDGKIAIVQFHGVPDVAHPWVHTPPERFEEYMTYLKDNGFNVIALRDLDRYVDPANPPEDPMRRVRYGGPVLELPQEVQASRADFLYWLRNMLGDHRYALAEAAPVFGFGEDRLKEEITKQLGEHFLEFFLKDWPGMGYEPLHIMPYPGGRHPRIGFLDGAVAPLRGTKVSVFAPWGGYVVVDLPEAIFSTLGLTFLAHTHIPTIWDDANVHIENRDWGRALDGSSLHNRWALPNGIGFESKVELVDDGVAMEIHLDNQCPKPLSDLRTQVCVMLKGMPGLTHQTEAGKLIRDGITAANVAGTNRWVIVGFTPRFRGWQNPNVPCIHSDPIFPDTLPGHKSTVRGRLIFYEGDAVEEAMDRLALDLG
jgi:peptidoglycan/xylan/chitin deacetylase (PgdA/CDA1 family)